MIPKEIQKPPDDLISKYLSRNYDQDKYDKLKVVVLSQLQKYSENGKRLYKINKVGIRPNEAIEYAKILTEEFFRDENKGKIVYDLIFGRGQTSYHSVKLKCELAQPKFTLKTTPMEWFYSIPDRMQSGKLVNSKVKVECEYGHKTYKFIDQIGRFGCSVCDENKKTEEGWYSKATKRIEHDYIIKYLEDTNYELVSDKTQFNNAIYEAKSRGKRRVDIFLKWRHECGYEFFRSYFNMMRYFSCPKCSQNKNQKITYELSNYIFETSFEVERYGPLLSIRWFTRFSEAFMIENLKKKMITIITGHTITIFQRTFH
ncbi:MAG: hypothetical protein ACFFAO_03865, partial [Candidatus Hermodarchaeota archaeon]